MMKRLSDTSGFGRHFYEEAKPTYEIVGEEVPEHVRRSVELINQYDNSYEHYSAGVATHEDRPVTTALRKTTAVLFLLTGLPAAILAATLGGEREIAILLLLATVTTLLVDRIGGLFTGEKSLIAYTASRHFGAPVLPRDYVAKALKQGQIVMRYQDVITHEPEPVSLDDWDIDW
jgi:hypothetical protein